MSSVGQPERVTQDRVIALFRDQLDYSYVGDWTDRDGNSNIEDGRLSAWLVECGYTPAQISAALHRLHTEADNHGRGLYGNNHAVYNLLRYGVPVKTEAGKATETVHLINWQEPERNEFAIAEEVTLKGNQERRPDVVLYVGRERLDTAVEALVLLCEPVEPPQGELQHIHYFCGNTEIASDLKEREPQRTALYQATVALVRAYANIADELDAAGYSTSEIRRIKEQVDHYLKVREIIRKASGETLDLKAYEADMRHLMDTYIEADEPRKISPFDGMSLLELMVKTGIYNAIDTQLGGFKDNKKAVAETIENNVRSKILKEHLTDPSYYEKMSALLDEIIADRKAEAIEYEEYLRRIARLAREVEAGLEEDTPEELKNSPALRALYNNLKSAEETPAPADRVAEAPEEYDASVDPVLEKAKKIDAAVKQVRPDDWRGVQAREQVIKAALYEILRDQAEVERIFLIIKAQSEY